MKAPVQLYLAGTGVLVGPSLSTIQNGQVCLTCSDGDFEL